MYNSFFEIMISVTAAMGLVKHWEWLYEPDQTSIYFQFFFAALLVAYLVFVFYFAIVKSSKFALREAGLRDERHIMKLEKLHGKVLEQVDGRGCSDEELQNARK